MARRPPIIYAAFRRILAEAEKWDADERDAWLRKRTLRTAKMARHLPVYRDRLRSDNISEWPVLKKSDILDKKQHTQLSDDAELSCDDRWKYRCSPGRSALPDFDHLRTGYNRSHM